MKKLYLLLVIFLACRVCDAQNLVPNGDFEQYVGCPNAVSQLDSTLFWQTPSAGSPDYYNQCDTTNFVGVPLNQFGNQNAHSGAAYSGIYVWAAGNYREFLEVQLLSPLSANTCYHFQMFVNLANIVGIAVDSIGVYFSNQFIYNSATSGNLGYTPQLHSSSGFITDTLNWTLVSANYVASGGENFMIIGNFNNNINTDTVMINPSAPKNHRSYIYIDDISLYSCTTGIEEQNASSVNIYPNPFTINLSIKNDNYQPCEIILYDITSRRILQQNFTTSTTLNTSQLSKGMYLYEVRNKNGVVKKGKVVKE